MDYCKVTIRTEMNGMRHSSKQTSYHHFTDAVCIVNTKRWPCKHMDRIHHKKDCVFDLYCCTKYMKRDLIKRSNIIIVEPRKKTQILVLILFRQRVYNSMFCDKPYFTKAIKSLSESNCATHWWK